MQALGGEYGYILFTEPLENTANAFHNLPATNLWLNIIAEPVDSAVVGQVHSCVNLLINNDILSLVTILISEAHLY